MHTATIVIVVKFDEERVSPQDSQKLLSDNLNRLYEANQLTGSDKIKVCSYQIDQDGEFKE